MVRGAVRNLEPWRNKIAEEESTEQRLDRLEREEAEAAGEEEKNAMADLEVKNADARREMAAADALDEIRHRNARINRSEKDGVDYADTIVRTEDEERERLEREDAEAAARAFAAAARGPVDGADGSDEVGESSRIDGPAPVELDDGFIRPAPVVRVSEPATDAPTPSFKRVVKKKKDHSALLGIKKKPSLV